MSVNAIVGATRMTHYWIPFVIEIFTVAVIAGSITRIVARLKFWSHKQTHYCAYFLYWLIYLMWLFVPRSFRLHFISHPFADTGHSFGSNLFAFLLMVVFSQLAVRVATICRAVGPGLTNRK